MAKAMEATVIQMREMAVELVQGRPMSAPPTGTPEIWQISNGKPSDYDYDSTPLSPGIEAVLEREDDETEQHRLMREREELQRQLIDKARELESYDLETSSPSLPDPPEPSPS